MQIAIPTFINGSKSYLNTTVNVNLFLYINKGIIILILIA